MADMDGAVYENNKRLRCVLLSVTDSMGEQAYRLPPKFPLT